MARLKGMVFGVENVLSCTGSPPAATMAEIGRLMRYLVSIDVTPVVLTNRNWTVTRTEGDKKETVGAKAHLEELWNVKLEWLTGGQGGMPWKQSAAALETIRTKYKWEPNEMLFVGNSDDDMRAAVNGEVLLLNAQWFKKTMDYGFEFKTPKDLARFVDVFCRREHWWFWGIDKAPLFVYALAPYGTKIDEYRDYSENFLRSVKSELGADGDEFWARYLCTSMYFSGLYKTVDYIASFPGHRKGSYHDVLKNSISRFVKCFRGKYLGDLIIRHTDAPESKTNRDAASHLNQFNTICLTQKPLKKDDERYKQCPLKDGKTVLVLDDICTRGFSLEAARAYLRQTGVGVIMVSLLKALNRDYDAVKKTALPKGPFAPNTLTASAIQTVTFPYRASIIDPNAPTELNQKLKHYKTWDWPNK
jgi:hypothetical protein